MACHAASCRGGWIEVRRLPVLGWVYGLAQVVAERDEVKCFLSSGFPAVAGSGAASAADKGDKGGPHRMQIYATCTPSNDLIPALVGVTSSPAVCPLSARACLMFASDYMMLPRPMIQAAQVGGGSVLRWLRVR